MAGNQTPQQVADKQMRRAKAAIQDYKDGIMNVKTSPMQAAAARVDAWFAGIQQAYQDGSYVDGLNSVTLNSWQDAATKKGAMNYSAGIDGAAQKILDFQTQRASAQAAISAQLAAMPRGDINANIQRMVTQVTGMHQFKFKKRRGT